jgi:fructokinase
VKTKETPVEVIGLGEVLWDVFPEGRRVGGAPYHFAYFCARLGAHSRIVSRVGNDQEGRELLEAISSQGVDPSLVQIDQERPTGMVKVSVGPDGVPVFECQEDAAWDYIELTDKAIAAVSTADIVSFGTLAQRKPTSWKTIHALLAKAPSSCIRVCDVNLRRQYYSPEFITESFLQADVVKINEQELEMIREILNLSPDDDEAARFLVDEFDLQALVLTLGPKGAKTWSQDSCAEVPGLVVRVHDTVGSGDAFAATFAMELVRGSSLSTALYWANVAGAYVATQPGATPDFSWEILRTFGPH